MMKKCMLALVFMSVVRLYAADISVISRAFATGEVAPLAVCMDAEVDIAVQDKTRKADATEAVARLTRFFEANRPGGFTVAHHAERDGSGFVVGKLAAGGGEFRVNIAYVVKDGKVVIQSVRIE
ncbi:MAG: DUF4783 domain-containing protein [Tannerella sp.]|jgi:hypothetical protein|nr:DUF4783 domain-containing protein [Tannerella sp.]